jgi:hypothetical protein
MQVSDEAWAAVWRAFTKHLAEGGDCVAALRAALAVLPEDAWHSGWRVAVRERDEARAELQRERLRHAQTRDQADRFAAELGELRRAEPAPAPPIPELDALMTCVIGHIENMQRAIGKPERPASAEEQPDWHAVGDGAFARPFGTIRVCIDCGALVAGGPTRCGRCAHDDAWKAGGR